MPSATSESINLNFRIWLQQQFTDRCRRNPRFSLRAFARMLGTEPTSISQILAGKRKVSKKTITRICDRLSATPDLRSQFLPAKTAEAAEPDFRQLTADAFAVMADWHHYAILELTYVKGFQSHPRWIANKLSISQAEASIAVDRLLRLELLAQEKGRLVKTDAFLTNFKDGFTAPALKELQRQILQKGMEAIEFTKAEEKDITSMTMAVDLKQLPEARQKIKKFRRELSAFLEKGERELVYHLGIQLYPVSNKEKSHA